VHTQSQTRTPWWNCLGCWWKKQFESAQKKLEELENEWGLSVLLEKLAFSRTQLCLDFREGDIIFVEGFAEWLIGVVAAFAKRAKGRDYLYLAIFACETWLLKSGCDVIALLATHEAVCPDEDVALRSIWFVVCCADKFLLSPIDDEDEKVKGAKRLLECSFPLIDYVAARVVWFVCFCCFCHVYVLQVDPAVRCTVLVDSCTACALLKVIHKSPI
jgi:hypothetical protein